MIKYEICFCLVISFFNLFLITYNYETKYSKNIQPMMHYSYDPITCSLLYL